jgi:CubicO group peptidase (beta-lactamase class C family)
MENKMCKRTLFLLVLVSLVFSNLIPGNSTALASESGALTPVNAGNEHSDLEIESFVDHFIQERMGTYHVPGLVVVVVDGGKQVLSKGYGFADIERQVPMTALTNLRAGSVSKPVIATAILQLVERGLIRLDAPVSEYIQDLDLTDAFGPASTVAQLLTQQGGYTDDILLSHSPTQANWQPLQEYLAANLPRREIQPGIMSYSSWNYALLGDVIEKVTGLPYDQAIARNIFQPMRMENSTFTQPLPDGNRGNLATGYYFQQDEYKIVPMDFVRLSPGIGLVTNGEDMGRYMQTLLNDGRINDTQVLQSEPVQALLTRQAGAYPSSRGRTYAFSEITFSGRQVLYHSGNGIGFASEMILAPEHGFGIFVSVNHRMLNRDLSNWTPAAAIIRELEIAVLEKMLPETPSNSTLFDPLPDAAQRVQRYVGHYQTADASRHNFTQIAALLNYVDVWDNLDGTITIFGTPLVEVEPLVFQDKKNPGFFVVFIENTKGDVEYLTLGGTGSYRKAAWYQTINFIGGLLAGVSLIFLSVLITRPFLRRGHWLASVISLLNLTFLAGMALLLSKSDFLLLYKTIPLVWKIVLIMPWFSLIATLGLIAVLFRQWSKSRQHLWTKIYTTLVMVGSIAFLWLIFYWHMILI